MSEKKKKKKKIAPRPKEKPDIHDEGSYTTGPRVEAKKETKPKASKKEKASAKKA